MTTRYDALVVKEGEGGKKSFFTKIGAAFLNKDGKGWSIVLDALPTNGKILLREPLPKREPGDDFGE